MKYYVYELIDPRDNSIFYIGKGQNSRMYVHVCSVKNDTIPNGNLKLYNKIKKILSFGLRVKYKKVLLTDDEAFAYEKEKELINEIGLENLCNITEGGNGGRYWTGRSRSEETKRKISASKIGIPRSEETKKKISKSNARYWKGRSRSEETKQKISETKTGTKLSIDARKKVSENNARYWLGKTLSDEHRQNISIGMKAGE